MKKLLTLIFVAVAAFGCSYDDDALWSKVNDHEERLTQVEEFLRNASENGLLIADIEEGGEGWKITMSNGQELDIKQLFTAVDTGSDDQIGFTLQDGSTIYVKRLNFTDPDGAFFLNEGSSHGTVVWFDGDFNEYRDVYQKVNGGRNPGQYLQDMFIADGKIYLLCQQKGEESVKGDGQLLVCDAKTMKLLQAYNGLDFGHGAEGKPQHIVVAGNKAFIQYATDDAVNGWEYYGEGASGIRVFDLSSGTLKTSDIEGTYGPFGYGTEEIPTGGALKARMLYSRGKIIACLAKGVVFIDPVSETVTRTIEFTGGVKDIVKGADGNLYIAVTGDFDQPLDPMDYFASIPEGSKIYKYSQAGDELSYLALEGSEADNYEGIFNTSTAAANIGMCADFNSPYIYFNANTGMMGMGYVARYDYSRSTESAAINMEYVLPQRGNSIYGYLGVHPTHKHLFVPVNVNWTISRMAVYNVAMPSTPEKIFDTYQRYNTYTASPSGIYFTYSFSDEYFAK